ncbi:MAG TPA: carboxypeptidase regulatory-like domain-containing protein [Kofleriaceae bacterium]|nr:carboxypeptidase regulatory-like domain-containing protein [Kofleriaceae bacterium]
MRRWGFASFLSVLLIPLTASAQEADVTAGVSADQGVAPSQAIAYGAMPGGLHAPTAETLPKGAVQVSTLSGLGRRTGLLGPDHKFNRAIGDLAIAFGVTDMISIGLSLDGRYDKHWGAVGDASKNLMTTSQANGDDGYVGDPHLIVRAGKSTGSLIVGGQLGVWVPGKDAPSVAGSAISVDVRGLVSLPAGPGLLSFSAGFRLDNSAKSVDDPMKLSLSDRVSLGVSDYNAVFGGAQLRIPAGKAWVGIEGSLDAFVGGPGTPEMGQVAHAELARGKLIFRGGLTAGYHITDTISGIVFFEATKSPGVNDAQVDDANIPLVPYEPLLAGGIGLQARFGGPKAVKNPFDEKDCHKHNPPDCPAVKVPLLAKITGTVVDTGGKPVAGAKVSVSLKNSQAEPTVTDEKGAYSLDVRIGESVDGKETIDEAGVEVNVDVSGMKPGKASLAQIAKDTNTVPPITIEPVLPPGQLRGVVRSLPGGKNVEGAEIKVTPGDQKATTAADGTFTIDLAPGTYKISVTKNGLKTQELDVTIDPNGVAIKNIDLQK